LETSVTDGDDDQAAAQDGQASDDDSEEASGNAIKVTHDTALGSKPDGADQLIKTFGILWAVPVQTHDQDWHIPGSARSFDPRPRVTHFSQGGGGGVRMGDELSNRIKLSLPVQSPLAKIFSFLSDANHLHIPRHPGPHRGAFRDRHGRRARDAVDAGGAAQTSCADEALISRTAKSCGPDASTPASSS
jgi:hypothetical protein